MVAGRTEHSGCGVMSGPPRAEARTVSSSVRRICTGRRSAFPRLAGASYFDRSGAARSAADRGAGCPPGDARRTLFRSATISAVNSPISFGPSSAAGRPSRAGVSELRRLAALKGRFLPKLGSGASAFGPFLFSRVRSLARPSEGMAAVKTRPLCVSDEGLSAMSMRGSARAGFPEFMKFIPCAAVIGSCNKGIFENVRKVVGGVRNV